MKGSLIRVTLRSLDGTVSKEDANRIYDLVYSELHEGTAGYFRAAHALRRDANLRHELWK